MSVPPALDGIWTNLTGPKEGGDDREAQWLLCTHSIDSTQDTGGLPPNNMEGIDQATPEGRTKRKVGRPIAYCGDPYAPNLEPEQRRVILRRIANRESARRVRARRQDELDQLTQRAQDTEQCNTKMHAKLKAAEAKEAQAMVKLANVRGHLRAQARENETLQAEISDLRDALAAVQQLQQESESGEAEMFPVLASLAPYRQDPLSMCDTLKKPNTPTGQAPALLSAFSREVPSVAPFQAQAQPLLPAMPNPVPERTFSDFLQDINWTAPQMDDWPSHAGCSAEQ